MQIWSYNEANVRLIKATLQSQRTLIWLIPPSYSSVIDYRDRQARGETVPKEVASIVSAHTSERINKLLKAIPSLRNHRGVWTHEAFAHEIASRHGKIQYASMPPEKAPKQRISLQIGGGVLSRIGVFFSPVAINVHKPGASNNLELFRLAPM